MDTLQNWLNLYQQDYRQRFYEPTWDDLYRKYNSISYDNPWNIGGDFSNLWDGSQRVQPYPKQPPMRGYNPPVQPTRPPGDVYRTPVQPPRPGNLYDYGKGQPQPPMMRGFNPPVLQPGDVYRTPVQPPGGFPPRDFYRTPVQPTRPPGGYDFKQPKMPSPTPGLQHSPDYTQPWMPSPGPGAY